MKRIHHEDASLRWRCLRPGGQQMTLMKALSWRVLAKGDKGQAVR